MGNIVSRHLLTLARLYDDRTIRNYDPNGLPEYDREGERAYVIWLKEDTDAAV